MAGEVGTEGSVSAAVAVKAHQHEGGAARVAMRVEMGSDEEDSAVPRNHDSPQRAAQPWHQEVGPAFGAEAGVDLAVDRIATDLGDLAAAYAMCPCVYPMWMTERNRRINVTLEPDYAQKLASLAERTHVQEGTLARSLLSSALDEADPDVSRITEILDGIPGAWERAQESIEQARRGETVPLSEL